MDTGTCLVGGALGTRAALQWLKGERLGYFLFLLLAPFAGDLGQALSPFLGGFSWITVKTTGGEAITAVVILTSTQLPSLSPRRGQKTAGFQWSHCPTPQVTHPQRPPSKPKSSRSPAKSQNLM